MCHVSALVLFGLLGSHLPERPLLALVLTMEYDGRRGGGGEREREEFAKKVGRCHPSPRTLPLGQFEKMMGLQFKDHHVTTEE